MKAKWMTYARIAPYPMEKPYYKNGKLYHEVCMKVCLPDFVPPYAKGRHVRLETSETVYQIYNPQRLAFDYDDFVNRLYLFVRYTLQETVISVEVVD